jgi:DivIVA domain-containing protein
MAISFSRPDPSSPAAVADAAFGTARRGFDQQEVRDFLRMVAAELARLQERERFLERELRAAQASSASGGAPVIDEDTATRLLGEETARVLTAARDGANAIRAKAEEGAARLLRDASEEAHRLREEADLEASRRRTDAASDAEAELAMAKQQGREMVEEARSYRERVLGELARRRDLARQQIEQLVHGRDRLLQAFERARLVAVDVVTELAPLSGPDEFVDLTPTTGPVPIMVPAANLGDASSIDDSVLVGTPTVTAETAEEAEEAEPEEAQPEGEDATVVSFPVAAETEEIDDGDVTATDVDDLFARLRSGQPDTPIDETAETEEPAAEVVDEAAETPFGRRDAALVPLIVAGARKLKRALADEQNEVLDGLRRKEPVRNLDVLVPWESEHGDRYADAVGAELIAAAEAGAAAMSDRVELDVGPSGPLAPVRDALRAGLVAPLRERLDRAVAEGDGDNDAIARRVRAVYREWKTQHIDEELDDMFRLAYGRGAFAGIEAGTRVSWIVDPGAPACPDCEDNSLAGPVVVADAFPTGHTLAPSHAGCRCLLAPVDD